MATQLAEQIIELRRQGLSYKRITKQLGCARSTVCYYCGKGQKDKYKTRQQRRRTNAAALARKIGKFLYRKPNNKTNAVTRAKTVEKILRERVMKFRFDKRTGTYAPMTFTLAELLTKLGDDPRCYLTGRQIDLTQPRTYQLDHIVPVSKGGDNSLTNCGLACREANAAKSDFSINEFVALCRAVVAHHDQNSATENRTPVSTLKGSRPKPLDDSAADTRIILAS